MTPLVENSRCYLRPYAPRCRGVDVQRLIAEATRVLEQVRTLGAECIGEINLADLPRVHFDAGE